MEYITPDILAFDTDDMFCDSGTASRMLLKIHYNLCVKPGLATELEIVDDILDKIVHHNNEERGRKELCDKAKQFIAEGRMTLVDALQVLFTLEEMSFFGY